MADKSDNKESVAINPAVAKALDVVASSPEQKPDQKPESEPTSDAAAASGTRWVIPAGRLRATMRWILAVFGTVGVAFLAAVPLAGLQSLTWPGAASAIAVSGALLVVGGVVLALRAGGEVFISRAGTLTDLRKYEESDAPADERRNAPYEVYGGFAEGADDLVAKWDLARVRRDLALLDAVLVASPDGRGPHEATIKGYASLCERQFIEIDAISTSVMQLVAYRELLAIYRWAQQRVFAGAVLVVVGVLAFFAAVQSPSDDDGGGTPSSPPVAAPAPVALAECFSTQGLTRIASSDNGMEVFVRIGDDCQRLAFPLPAPPPNPPSMTTYFWLILPAFTLVWLIFLVRGPKWRSEPRPDALLSS